MCLSFNSKEQTRAKSEEWDRLLTSEVCLWEWRKHGRGRVNKKGVDGR